MWPTHPATARSELPRYPQDGDDQRAHADAAQTRASRAVQGGHGRVNDGAASSFLASSAIATISDMALASPCDIPVEIPLADDGCNDDPSDAADHAPRPQPENDDQCREPVCIGSDMPYIGVLAAIRGVLADVYPCIGANTHGWR